MADRVRFIMDQMAPIFHKLQSLEIFQKEEIQQIIKKITDYEYILRRRQLFEDDFLKYVEYMQNVEKLYELRYSRIKNVVNFEENQSNAVQSTNETEIKASIIIEQKNSRTGAMTGTSTSTKTIATKDNGYRLVQSQIIRHISYIFDRATRRFPNTISLWLSHISYLKSHQSKALLNTTYGKLLSLHPKVEMVWIEAARHEIQYNQNAHTTRILLQRGLRFNPTSEKLWLYYFEFEVWNAVRIKDRKRLLDLDEDNSALLGAPMIVISHALSSIPKVTFAIEFLKIADDISNVLVIKMEETIEKLFPNSQELFLFVIFHRLGCDMNYLASSGHGSHIDSDNYHEILSNKSWHNFKQIDGISKISAPDVIHDSLHRIHKALERIQLQQESIKSMSSDQKNVWIPLLLQALYGISERIGYDLSQINPLSINYLTKQQRLSHFMVLDSNILTKNTTAWIELENQLSKLDSVMKCVLQAMIELIACSEGDNRSQEKEEYILSPRLSICIAIIYNIRLIVDHLGRGVDLYPSIKMLLLLQSNYYSRGNRNNNTAMNLLPGDNDDDYDDDDNSNIKPVIQWIDASLHQMRDHKKRNKININNKKDHIEADRRYLSNTVITLVMKHIKTIGIGRQSKSVMEVEVEFKESMKSWSSLLTSYLNGWDLFLSDDYCRDSMEYAIDTLFIHHLDMNHIVTIIKHTIHSDDLPPSCRCKWFRKYLDYHNIVHLSNYGTNNTSMTIESNLVMSRKAFIEAFAEINDILTTKPYLRVNLIGLDELYLYIIQKEEIFRDCDIITPIVSYNYLKGIVELAIQQCSNKLFYNILENLERSMGNHKLANHIHWRKSYSS